MVIETEEQLRENFISAQKKLQQGAKPEDLTEDEMEAIQIAQQQQQQQQGAMDPMQRKLAEFAHLSQNHKGNRILHITDTEADPDDLEKILEHNLSISQGLKDNDIVVHTGDLLSDFIDFKQPTLDQFTKERIIEEGGLEGAIEEEFKEAYKHMLEQNGIDEYNLLEGQITQEMLQRIQYMYFGMIPNFLTNEEREEYKEHYETFKKHLTTAIKNDARKKYQEYRKILEDKGLTPENTLILEGNHDVPDVMREILGDYMLNPGEVGERKGVRFGNPLNGSTGPVLGQEFGDVFGYTDVTEKLEQYKHESQSFQDLLSHLKNNGVNYIDEKDLSQLIQISQQRAAQGIGKGGLAHYFDSKIKPEIDNRVSSMRGQVVNRVPKDVDFYVFHGMPNGPHAGIEEKAAYKAIENAGGGNILHGHMHGKTTHKMGKSLLLNPGDGKQGFGAYLYDKGSGVGEIFSKTYNKTLENHEFDLIHSNQLGPQKSPRELSGQ